MRNESKTQNPMGESVVIKKEFFKCRKERETKRADRRAVV